MLSRMASRFTTSLILGVLAGYAVGQTTPAPTSSTAAGNMINSTLLRFQYPIVDFGSRLFQGEDGCSPSANTDFLMVTQLVVPTKEEMTYAIRSYSVPEREQAEPNNIIYMDLETGNIIYATSELDWVKQLNYYNYTVLLPNLVDLPQYTVWATQLQSAVQSLIIGTGTGPGTQNCTTVFPELQVVYNYLGSVLSVIKNVTNLDDGLRPTETRLPGNCISESDANYEGSLVQSLRGQKFSQGDCCSACYNTTGCNVWVWCPAFEGCMYGNGTIFPTYACDLKTQPNLTDPTQAPLAFSRGPPTPFTSGRIVV